MAVEMVRIPSETPNINNIDDFVGLRYAYGNQDGYVIGKGNECSYTINGSIFKINSGRLVLQGIECDIDANGVEIVVDNVATKQYYSVYLQVNLALNETKILATTDTARYPAIETGDDLTQNTTGIARMVLYTFDVQNGDISNVIKQVMKINYIEDVVVKNANNTKTINNIEINEDENGILKIGDVVVSQKKIIWNGELSLTPDNVTTDTMSLNETINDGDVLEVEYKFQLGGIYRTCKKRSKHVVDFSGVDQNIIRFSEIKIETNVTKLVTTDIWLSTNSFQIQYFNTYKTSSETLSITPSFTVYKIYKIIE